MADSRSGVRISKEDWETFYWEYFPMVRDYFVSKKLAPVDADDLAQELFKELARRGTPRDPGTYIRAMSRSMLSQYRRSKAKASTRLHKYLCNTGKSDAGDANSHEADVSVIEEIEGTTLEELMRVASGKLSPRCFEPLRLRLIEHLDIKEIAHRMACSQPAVRKRLERARQSLQQLRQQQEDDE